VESYKSLAFGSELSAVGIEGIYMRFHYETLGRKDRIMTKSRLVPIAAVVAIRPKEDETKDDHTSVNDDPATYKGRCLLISNRCDAPREVLTIYGKRWR